jgi:hypothetical protein
MPHGADVPVPGPTGDYGYDLVHEADLAAPTTSAAPAQHPPVYVATQTSDTEEDYSYDLAHDVPRRH